MGYEPARVSGVSYWYHSPFRKEKTPSFKVNRNKNKWYDFGEGSGGNLVDFMVKKDGNDIREVLKKLSGYKGLEPAMRLKDGNEKHIEIIDVLNISSFALIRYYQSRRIHRDVVSSHASRRSSRSKRASASVIG
jgi:DNA primase